MANKPSGPPPWQKAPPEGQRMPRAASASSEGLKTLPGRISCVLQASPPGPRPYLLRSCLNLDRSLMSTFTLGLSPQETYQHWLGSYLWARPPSGPCALAALGLPGLQASLPFCPPSARRCLYLLPLPSFLPRAFPLCERLLWCTGSLQVSSGQVLLRWHFAW